jgi:hypothetical protein
MLICEKYAAVEQDSNIPLELENTDHNITCTCEIRVVHASHGGSCYVSEQCNAIDCLETLADTSSKHESAGSPVSFDYQDSQYFFLLMVNHLKNLTT